MPTSMLSPIRLTTPPVDYQETIIIPDVFCINGRYMSGVVIDNPEVSDRDVNAPMEPWETAVTIKMINEATVDLPSVSIDLRVQDVLALFASLIPNDYDLTETNKEEE